MGSGLRAKRPWRSSVKAQLVNASSHQVSFDPAGDASGRLDHPFLLRRIQCRVKYARKPRERGTC